MAKIKAKTRAKVKRTQQKSIKAGATMPKNIGGYVNAKVVAIVRKNHG